MQPKACPLSVVHTQKTLTSDQFAHLIGPQLNMVSSDRIEIGVGSGASRNLPGRSRPFEMKPLGALRLDGFADLTRMLLPGERFARFERTAVRRQKFETCPRWGANSSNLRLDSNLCLQAKTRPRGSPGLARVRGGGATELDVGRAGFNGIRMILWARCT